MKLFISYARVDRYRVNELVDILRDAGYEPWFDHRLLPGQDWQAELLRAVRMCDAFLYALSPESVESEWCQWEFSQAIQMGKPVIPVLLQARTKLPEAISRFQYADFSEGPTARSVARLMGGLRVVQVVVPVEQAPPVTANPSGLPAQAETVGAQRAAPAQTPQPAFTPPDVSHILPPPFEWCYVPQGFVTLGDSSDRGGTKGGSYEVPAFYIARYPITNAQYQVFVEAKDGYQNAVWWDYSDHAKRWRKENPKPKDTAFLGDTLPRTNVNWYDAVAFYRWLNSRVGTQRAASLHITLPTEQQWQRAAQGDDGRVYPWGDTFDIQFCNIEQSRVRQPTSVLEYANGASPYGVLNMAGNIWEMCLNDWGTRHTLLDSGNHRIMRGGAFYCTEDEVRTATLDDLMPNMKSYCIGFRCVAVVSY